MADTMAHEFVIGVDQGTSSTKALLLNRDGRVMAAAQRPIAVSTPEPGWVEQDPGAMLGNVVACVREVLDKADALANQVAGIGIDNHTETLVLWDRETAEPVHPAIVWQCRRSTAETEAIDTPETRRLVRDRTGLDLDPTFTATKLMWVVRHQPDIARAIRDGRVLIGTVDCWLVWMLTGGARYVTESSNASRTMLFRIDDLAWDPELAALFEIETPDLAEVLTSTGPFGETDRPFFDAAIPITGVLGDQQAALFGHGCFEAGEFKSTYGTGAFVWMNAGHDYRPVHDAGFLQTVAWHLDRPTYALEGFVMYAGAVLDWLVDNLGLGRDAAEITGRAQAAGASDGVIMIPAFQGLASPWWSPNARASLLGMSSATRAEQICHAALESVCFQVRRVLEDMAGADIRPRGDVKADGGLTRSAYLMQMQADVLGMPVRPSEIEHLTPYGVGLLAGLGAGLWDRPEALRGLTTPGAVFAPRADAAEPWTDSYNAWCDAIDWSLAGLNRSQEG